MEEIKLWASVIGQLGLPITITFYWIFIERPKSQAREDSIRKEFAELLKEVITEMRKDDDEKRREDKTHALEVQKLAGDIHLRATMEMTKVIDRHTEEVKGLMGKLDRAIDAFVKGGK